MNPDRIPSFGAEIERVPSKKTPVYESKSTSTHVREYDIFGGNEYYLGFVNQKNSKVEQLQEFASYLKSFWERVATFLPVPAFQVVVGKLSTGQEGVYVVVETVIEPKPWTDEILNARNEALLDFVRKYAEYAKVSGTGHQVWVDLLDENIKYGHTKENPQDKWYVVDLDPVTRPQLMHGDKSDIALSLSRAVGGEIEWQEIKKILD